GFEQRPQLRGALAVTRNEIIEGFGVGDVHAADAGEQELAPHRRHGIEDLHLQSAGGKALRGHQSGGAAADHRRVQGWAHRSPRSRAGSINSARANASRASISTPMMRKGMDSSHR